MIRRLTTAARNQATSISPRAVLLANYKPFPFIIDSVHLSFDLDEEITTCTSTLAITTQAHGTSTILELDGQELQTVHVELAGKEITEGSGYTIAKQPDGDHVMKIVPPSATTFDLKITTEIRADENTKLEGLYRSSGNFVSQCEAQGFRRITWYPDRPDVMSKFTVELQANKLNYPILLSNGNLVSTSDESTTTGRHSAVWVDPFAKPAYLFALVAGDLAKSTDHFITASGRNVELNIFTEAHNADKVDFAMNSLKQSFQWDEDRFRLEYDLDLFNIVAVDDFNMGAMENKSLNVFNSRLVLASPDTATDIDYERIQGVIGHEYFHNWTGNRVTCRDWFQLSLKEGLTVFRDQEFTSDLNSRGVKRIADVRLLRSAQFPEDAGAMAHPVRPSSYEKIDNFYSVTVYEKGAELIRMYHTLLGEEGFQKGMDLYFQRHDGCAVTTDDFYLAMDDATSIDGISKLGPSFKQWYDQAGTPELTVTWQYGDDGVLELQTTQRVPMTPDVGGNVKRPVTIPLAVGLLNGNTGDDLILNEHGDTTIILRCDDETNVFKFDNIVTSSLSSSTVSTASTSTIVPSILRNFSAPVRLTTPQIGREEMAFLLQHDSDQFNRSEAARNLMEMMIHDVLTTNDINDGGWDYVEGGFGSVMDALRDMLNDHSLDPAFRALALAPPSTSELVDEMEDGTANPLQINEARRIVLESIAETLGDDLLRVYRQSRQSVVGPYKWNPDTVGSRALSSRCLSYLMSQKDNSVGRSLALRQFDEATNMTDSFGALGALNGIAGIERDDMMATFLSKWSNDVNVVIKYFMLESTTDISGNTERVRSIFEHSTGVEVSVDTSVIAAADAFDVTTPNHVYALLRAFSSSNVNFHAEDGSGYKFLADAVIAVDTINAQVGSRLAGPFTKWKKFDKGRQELIQHELQRMMDSNLSPNTREIISKCLKQGSGGVAKL